MVDRITRLIQISTTYIYFHIIMIKHLHLWKRFILDMLPLNFSRNSIHSYIIVVIRKLWRRHHHELVFNETTVDRPIRNVELHQRVVVNLSILLFEHRCIVEFWKSCHIDIRCLKCRIASTRLSVLRTFFLSRIAHIILQSKLLFCVSFFRGLNWFLFFDDHWRSFTLQRSYHWGLRNNSLFLLRNSS